MLSTYSAIDFLKSVEEKAFIALKLFKNNPKYVELIPSLMPFSHIIILKYTVA